MVRIIPFGVLLKLWASGQSDAFLCMFITPFGIYSLCSYILHVIHLLLRQAKSFPIYAENFYPGGLRKWQAPRTSSFAGDPQIKHWDIIGSKKHQTRDKRSQVKHKFSKSRLVRKVAKNIDAG